MGLTVGIDLGTTNSAIAYLDTHNTPQIILNAENSPITPSVICFRDGEILVGDEAKEMQALGVYPVAAFFKREMGDPMFIFYADGVAYTALALSTLILGKLKADAEARRGEEVTEAVITVPAYFKDPERKATIEAGAAAGLKVLQVINEPTAAAVAYGLNHNTPGQRLLVYDLGGGTFDVTLLELTRDGVRVLNSDGDHQLGGKDWDDRLIEYISGQFQDEFGSDPLENAESLADLLILAEDAKKKLTSFESAQLSLVHDGNRGRYLVTRDAFESITSDLMERTISLTHKVLEDKRLRPKDVAGVLLVGGSTRMPMVHRFITESFGRPPMTGVNVDEAVALGAALVAAEQSALRKPSVSRLSLSGPVKTIDVTNHSLGMIAVNSSHTAYVNSVILPKNVEIPCNQTRPYQHRTRRRGDNLIEVFMTQGESDSPADVTYIGKYVIHDIPHERSGLTVIDVDYTYDRSGTVQVSARVKSSGAALRVSIEDLPLDVPDRFMVPPEPIQTKPEFVTAYLAFDLSGSMSGPPLEEAKAAAYQFVNNTDLTHCSLGVIAFSDTVRTKLKASQNARSIKRAINELTVAETGGGNAGHPFDEIYTMLEEAEGRRFGIVLADGVWARPARAISRAQRCHGEEIDIIAIGFGGADRDFLDKIASSEEGSFFTSMEGLVETFSTIAQVLTETGGGNHSGPTRPSSGSRLGFLSSLGGILKR